MTTSQELLRSTAENAILANPPRFGWRYDLTAYEPGSVASYCFPLAWAKSGYLAGDALHLEVKSLPPTPITRLPNWASYLLHSETGIRVGVIARTPEFVRYGSDWIFRTRAEAQRASEIAIPNWLRGEPKAGRAFLRLSPIAEDRIRLRLETQARSS